ncbi:hypothetical protein COX27_00835 [Candidatus Kuenenbacteria bacterium CG23_combo_of_CG06-09_8_20_14_all_36_9]|uniref:Polysaccharide chain length determinant N-terminal domain-containing protein n=1 Tax=Candidatus Kuenenbacteria bacterium CG10_big_fil_rev_8_21_14_0_10_36_11 TaxID=1974618 RepID=A0A2M6W9X3_9BACT|nr:MAG: hypothetical protein COX27_00835 [Candidatus Kuenenbacteria bacterium CG23_combo_of_CG06-09_8_20_14_all_36_9]PIT89554.1 MAG: hypothetical protein COU23_03395 [Candidatus Kuenenbacteria bacterium CG10_big_fil_rev_8_21_14_0_10_36_11]
MNQINYPQIIKNNWQTIAITSLIVIVLALGLSLFQPLQYRSRVEFLIIQKQSLTMDAYAAARASEKMASGLATIIRTKSFFDKVMNSNFGISRSNFPDNEKALRKYWQKNTLTSVSPETSLLQVNVYHKDKKEANKIALAIASVLVNDYGEYYGTNTDTIIKVVNEPLVSDYPVRPNIITNGIVGLVIGLTISISWIIYEENKKTNYQNIIENNETKIISMYQPINN